MVSWHLYKWITVNYAFFKLSEVGNSYVQNFISEEAFILKVKQLSGPWRIIKSLSPPRMLKVCMLELRQYSNNKN